MGPGVEPGLFVTTTDAPSPSHGELLIFLMLTRSHSFLLDPQPLQLAPAASSDFLDPSQAAAFHNYQAPSTGELFERHEDTHGVYYTPLLFSNQVTPTVPTDAFPQQPLSMSAQPLPLLRPIQVSTQNTYHLCTSKIMVFYSGCTQRTASVIMYPVTNFLRACHKALFPHRPPTSAVSTPIIRSKHALLSKIFKELMHIVPLFSQRRPS